MLEGFVIEQLRKSVAPRARQAGGTYHVEYGRPFKAVSVAAWLVLLASIMVCLHPSTKIEPLAVPVVIGMFLALALFLHSEFFLVSITYGDPGVNVYSRWGGHRGIAWGQIASVHFSKLGQNYVVEVRDGEPFTFNPFMSGYGSLLEELQKKGAVLQ